MSARAASLVAAARAACVAALLALAAPIAVAAPLPPFKPVDLCGTIVSREWQPPHVVPARPGGASGTLGRDRAFPGQFHVVLERYSGIDAETARRINGALGLRPADGDYTATPPRILLLLPHDDPRHLDGATALCVDGFTFWGDEGGTWTRYRSLSVTR